MSVLVYAEGKPSVKQPLDLCIRDSGMKCHQVTTNSAGLIEIPLTLAASEELHSTMSVSISVDSGSSVEWGVILLSAVPGSGN